MLNLFVHLAALAYPNGVRDTEKRVTTNGFGPCDACLGADQRGERGRVDEPGGCGLGDPARFADRRACAAMRVEVTLILGDAVNGLGGVSASVQDFIGGCVHGFFLSVQPERKQPQGSVTDNPRGQHRRSPSIAERVATSIGSRPCHKATIHKLDEVENFAPLGAGHFRLQFMIVPRRLNGENINGFFWRGFWGRVQT